jgi:DNA-binding transcriptional ArsR family regulator
VTSQAVESDAVLAALAEPRRRRILTLVRDGELPAGEIARHFDITPQAVSQHLRVLKDAGVLEERRAGTRRLYSIRPEAIESVRSFLDEVWPASLARLKHAVEAGRPPARSRGGGSS